MERHVPERRRRHRRDEQSVAEVPLRFQPADRHAPTGSSLKRIRLTWFTGLGAAKVSSLVRGYAQSSSSVRRPPCLRRPRSHLAAAPKSDAVERSPRSPERERWEDGWRPWAWCGADYHGERNPRARAWGFLPGGRDASRDRVTSTAWRPPCSCPPTRQRGGPSAASGDRQRCQTARPCTAHGRATERVGGAHPRSGRHPHPHR